VSFASEFKEFAMRGPVVDLAVGVIIGAAFGKIVASLVENVLMPVIGLFLGGVNVSDWATKIGVGSDGKDVMLKYGLFLQSVIDFLIIALVIFVAIKALNKLKKPAPAAAAAAPAPPRQEVLLEEIRNLLARR
jgi:large conductance mechanosensitive channel